MATNKKNFRQNLPLIQREQQIKTDLEIAIKLREAMIKELLQKQDLKINGLEEELKKGKESDLNAVQKTSNKEYSNDQERQIWKCKSCKSENNGLEEVCPTCEENRSQPDTKENRPQPNQSENINQCKKSTRMPVRLFKVSKEFKIELKELSFSQIIENFHPSQKIVILVNLVYLFNLSLKKLDLKWQRNQVTIRR